MKFETLKISRPDKLNILVSTIQKLNNDRNYLESNLSNPNAGDWLNSFSSNLNNANNIFNEVLQSPRLKYTIVCQRVVVQKGKPTTIKVNAISPKCPAGYKKK